MRRARSKRFSMRFAIFFVSLGLIYVLALSFYKGTLIQRFSQQSLKSLETQGPVFKNLFQASFYFFYQDQFLPGVQKKISETPQLEKIQILSKTGRIIFDSANPPSEPPSNIEQTGELHSLAKVRENLNSEKSLVFESGYRITVLSPSEQFVVLYTFYSAEIRNKLILWFVFGLVLAFFIYFITPRLSELFKWNEMGSSAVRWAGLRAKFLITIVLINLITGGIIFVTLSRLQTQELGERIQKDSILFSQFSTGKVISDFSNFFYFYYQDRFLPSVRSVIATNENLISIKIISHRTLGVLFDSEQASESPVPEPELEKEKILLSDDELATLRAKDIISRQVSREGERFLSVINTFKNENQEALFYIEYLFSFQALRKSVDLLRRQILIDLIPSMFLGLLIAVFFSQLLIRPIRRLVKALKRVSEGDYEVSVDVKRMDEIGDLVSAFNSMTVELRKKTELRKYLSDSTYKQIMQAAETSDGVKIGGSRVQATVLFSDIRNFVSHCENLDAEEVTSMLNEYFSEMVEVVHKHGGEVDKFIGDALLAVFYQGEELSSTTLQAIYCALEMRERLKEFNQKRVQLNKNTIEIGVGITFGDVISGPIGSKDRMDFTVIGDVVNLANRIEKLSKQGKYTRIVFSNHVEEKIRGLLDYEKMDAEKIRGKEEDVLVYELIRIKNLDELVKRMKEGDYSVKVQSIELLGQSRNPEAIPHLIQTLSDDDEKIRVQIILALAKLTPVNQDEVVDVFFKELKGEKSERVISALITSLGRICRTDRLLDLLPYLEHTNERVVANAIESVGMIKHPEASDRILPMLTSRNNRIKANAAMALFAAGHVEVIEMLKPMLMHSDPLMRSSAAFAIGELTTLAQKERLIEEFKTKTQRIKTFLAELQECVPMLVSLLKDQEKIVKRQAIIALGKIKDRSAVLPILDNIDFEHDSKELLKDIAQALRSIGSHKLVREILDQLNKG